MKSYTDIEQSKKLAKILPIESADMRYAPFGDTHPWVWDDNLLEKGSIPCWSLAALLGWLNRDWYATLHHDGICWQCIIEHHDKKERHCSNVLSDEPVDCCVELAELIIKLK